MDDRPMPPIRPSDERVHVWPVGYRIPRSPYRVVRPLGLGGMGVVYEVEDARDGSRHALKALLRKHTNDPDLIRRLEFEVRIMRSLPPHPNLPRVGEIFRTPDGTVCFLMELLRGLSLRDTLRRSLQQFPPARAALLTVDVLDALSVVHRAGYVHRDVKPNNVFLTEEGRAVLLDFGVAKALFDAPGRPLTAKEWFPGTANYMAPEYLSGAKAVTPQFDVYAAGLVLWECITGRAAFARKNFAQTSYAIISKGVPSLRTVGFDWLPHEFMLVVERATARDPRHRYPTAEVFANGLRGVIPLLASWPQASARASIHPELTREFDGGHVTTRREIPQPMPKPAGEPPGGGGRSPVVAPDASPQAAPGDELSRDEPPGGAGDEHLASAGDVPGHLSAQHEGEGSEGAAELHPHDEWDATELHPQDEWDATEVRSPDMLGVPHVANDVANDGAEQQTPRVLAEPLAYASDASESPDDFAPDDEATSHQAELSAYLSTLDPFGDTERASTPDALEHDAAFGRRDENGPGLPPALEPTLRSNEEVGEARAPAAHPSEPDAPPSAALSESEAEHAGDASTAGEPPPGPAARTLDGRHEQGEPGDRASDVTPDLPSVDPGAPERGEGKSESDEETDPFGTTWPPYVPARPELMLPPRPTWGLARQARRDRDLAALEAAEASSAPAPPGSEEERFFDLADMETNLRNTDDDESGASAAPTGPVEARRWGRLGRLGSGLAAALSRALSGVVRPLGLLVAARAVRLLGAAFGRAPGGRSSRPPPPALPAPLPAGEAAATSSTSGPAPSAPQPQEREET